MPFLFNGYLDFSCALLICAYDFDQRPQMPQKKKIKSPDLFEYKISFKVDERATTARRHYLAHNARDALSMFAYALLKSLFNRKAYEKQEFIIAKEFVKLYDKSFQTPKFQMEEDLDSDKPHKDKKINKLSASQSTDSVEKIVKEMGQRIKLVKFEEFNRWSKRWNSFKLPLEEVYSEQQK